MQSSSTEGHPSPCHLKGDGARKFERFDKQYKIHKEWEFKPFRVFKVLWSEPEGGGDGEGSHDTISVRGGRYGIPMFEKVRRFLIISPQHGHCLCLPLNTYLKQGVMKLGVHAEHHTIAHTIKEPCYLDGEREKGMTKQPIRVEPATPRDKLEPQTRLNYAKVYTVEYNVKVVFIGKVHRDFRSHVVKDYNSTHPQLSYGGYSEGNTTGGVGGWTDDILDKQSVSTVGASSSDTIKTAIKTADQQIQFGESSDLLSSPWTEGYLDRHTDALDEEDSAEPEPKRWYVQDDTADLDLYSAV